MQPLSRITHSRSIGVALLALVSLSLCMAPQAYSSGPDAKDNTVSQTQKAPPTGITKVPPKKIARRAEALIVPPQTVQKTILLDGNVQILYPDGTKKILFPCGWKITFPDGRESVVLCSEAQPPTPPPAPTDAATETWLQAHNEDLLATLRILINNDDTALQNYFNNYEPAGTGDYEKAKKRTKMLLRLLSP